MREDDTAITQDDSGLLSASSIIRYSREEEQPIKNVKWDEFDEWAAEDPFAVTTEKDFLSVQRGILKGDYDVEEADDIRERIEYDGDDSDDDDDGDSKSIAEKTGNTFEFGDSVGSNRSKQVHNQDFDFPVECRSCGERNRMEGSMVCPQCSDEVDEDEDEYELVGKDHIEAEVFRIWTEDDQYNGNILAIGIDFPYHDVFVDWNLSAYDDPLDDAHVSVYSSMEDLEKVTEGDIQTIKTVSTDDVSKSESRPISKGLGWKYTDVVVGDQVLTVKLADTYHKRHVGLSKTESLDDFDGMLFQYPYIGLHKLVWRDMDFPIDVIHVEADGKIDEVGSIIQPGDAVLGFGKYALELPHGWCDEHGISKGDRIQLGQSVIDKAQSVDSRLEKIVGGSYHRRRKLQQQGEQLSLDCINRLDEAYRQQVWPDSVQKSPSWEGDDDVTQETQDWVESILEMDDPMWDEYDNVPMAAGLTVKREIKDSLKQSQGWSIDSIQRRLREEFPQMKPFERVRIARQEVSGVLNKSKMAAIQARKGDPLVRWVGPDDDSTTELCKSLSEETKDGVPFSEMVNLLEEYAKEYEGTPARADQGLPHFLCRYTMEIVE